MQINVSSYGDREMMTDALSAQKFTTQRYNTFANECTSDSVRSEFIELLNEEHQIEQDVYTEMSKRGWQTADQAQRDRIIQVRSKYQSQGN